MSGEWRALWDDYDRATWMVARGEGDDVDVILSNTTEEVACRMAQELNKRDIPRRSAAQPPPEAGPEPEFTRERLVGLGTLADIPAVRHLARFATRLLDERDWLSDGLKATGEALSARDRTIAELRTKIANMEDLWGFELLPNGGTRAKAIGKTLKFLANDAVTRHVSGLEAKVAEQAAQIAEIFGLGRAATMRARTAEAALADARRDAERLRAELEWIANPIAALQREAKASGRVLDGPVALRIAEDGRYLSSRALAALAPREEAR